MKKILLLVIYLILLNLSVHARNVIDVKWPVTTIKSMDITGSSVYEVKTIMAAPSCPEEGVFPGISGENNNRFILELNEDVNQDYVKYLLNMGCKVEVYVFNLVQVTVPTGKLKSIKELPFVKHIRPPSKVKENSRIIKNVKKISKAQSDFSLINISDAHKSGYLGQGVKIAILDTGFNPDNKVFKDKILYTLSFRARDGDISNGDVMHGDSVTEIVSKIAPKAKIIQVNFETDVEYVKALKELITQWEPLKPDIIITSVNLILPDDYYDGSGIKASLAGLAKQKGITLVSSAGNNAQTHYIGKYSDLNGNLLHNFTSKDDTLELELKKGDAVRIVMSWKDNWKKPSYDLDFGLFDDDLEPLQLSDNKQLASKYPPYEFLEITAPYSGPYHIAVRSGNKVYQGLPFMIYIYSNSAYNMEYLHPETSLDPGLPTSSEGITVGSVQSFYPYNAEPWSSRGKTTDNRIKPDIVAPGGIYCKSCNGLFEGTSSAAPQVAGAIALLLSKNHTLLPEELKQIIKKSAKDLGSPGEDPVFGAGLLNVNKAIKSI